MSRITQLEDDIKLHNYKQEAYHNRLAKMRSNILSGNSGAFPLLDEAIDAAEIVIDTLFLRYKK
ncbi:hypothetical protein RJP56_17755 [Shewanella baltica]|uniref:hypothetical protein n=1 Tax=Shewanella baltica TaxID=62322 RepID=UPI0002185B6F|nr:hypothetical protein [Shewanella baltica]AEH13800.1 hypothetical protein Sbal117_2063 [Shewanella baltica OS117]MDR9767907.1 hypothetical protein [Shewanella baltica]